MKQADEIIVLSRNVQGYFKDRCIREKTNASNVQKCAEDDGGWETDGDHSDLKKRVYETLLIVAVVIILPLTLQNAAGTAKLSEGLRLWLERFGLKSDFHSIRSNAHLALYFLFGIVLCLYGRECGWRWW